MTETPYPDYPETPIQQEQYPQDTYTEEYSGQAELDQYQNPNVGHGESMVSKGTIESIYNTEDILYRVEKAARGFQIIDGEWKQISDPIARDEFISMMINSMRSIINPNFMTTKLTADEAKELLMEKNEEFIDACNDEPTLDEDYVEYAINLHDISLQLFMGQVVEGWGAKNLRQLSAQIFAKDEIKSNTQQGFGFGFPNFGGKKQ